MTRRRFMFWLSFGMFTLAEKLNLHSIDGLAAAAMETTKSGHAEQTAVVPVHWAAAEDENWQWYEREHFIDGQWWLTGRTRPINKTTGDRDPEIDSYLEDRLVPANVWPENKSGVSKASATDRIQVSRRTPDASRRQQHGRPPSKWLRSLHADEIRIWLKTIECPEAGVSGMTYWTHLTRDHSFDPERIVGLTVEEQAKLHGAAHFGF